MEEETKISFQLNEASYLGSLGLAMMAIGTSTSKDSEQALASIALNGIGFLLFSLSVFTYVKYYLKPNNYSIFKENYGRNIFAFILVVYTFVVALALIQLWPNIAFASGVSAVMMILTWMILVWAAVESRKKSGVNNN